MPMDEILEKYLFGLIARFELYSITIEALDKQLDTISLNGCNKEVVYKRGDNEEIRLDEPLPLIGPQVAWQGEDPIIINFGVPGEGWIFHIKPEEEKKKEMSPKVKIVRDRCSRSIAKVCYDIIPCGVDAFVNLKYIDPHNRDLVIYGGMITATTDGNPDTLRILRKFSYECYQILSAGEEFKLEKSRVGVSLGSKIQVTVNLMCFYNRCREPFQISGSHTLKVPEKCSEVRDLYFQANNGDPHVMLKVTWSDEIAYKGFESQFPSPCLPK